MAFLRVIFKQALNMGKISAELPLNTEILRQCREQMRLSLDDVAKNVGSIKKIERGEKKPTYNQLNTLADLYEVPRWVFISKELPKEYTYSNSPSFRQFRNIPISKDSTLCKLIVRVETYRELFIELKEDLEGPIPLFSGIGIENKCAEKAAYSARQWLELKCHSFLNFEELKQKLEEKNIFIFLTSKFKGWSHIEQSFRGLCIHHAKLPIIVINNSDAKKAQSFTLIHELGHLLRKETAIDIWDASEEIEKWCDEFAGNFLMPKEDLESIRSIDKMATVKEHAKQFEVSPYAFLVRMRQIHAITEKSYRSFKNDLQKDYEQKKLRNTAGGPARNRSKEIKTQFGTPFLNTVMTALNDKKITLHKVSQLLDLKRATQVIEIAHL